MLQAGGHHAALLDTIATSRAACAFATGTGAFVVLLRVSGGLLLLSADYAGLRSALFYPHC